MRVPFDVAEDDFYGDLWTCSSSTSNSTGYVVIELKTGKFQAEHAGKLNFYVALVDDVLRRDHHNETIGILICGTKNDRSVRYSLGRSSSPMAVAAYTYDKLPEAEQDALPDEGHLVAALEWAEPSPDSEDSR
ncbi:PDDEXK nuclease domain-containing protein [Pseudarthrobacter sp.]|uniref:PDDEXK nuclease domain-containing protein n=1 Tax=Pseudarthrobacter sp. TaxID=1934409 RepID=UPI002FC645B4